ncbi:MAG: DUF368 domain-containing protein [Oscillospiraceae bacterium]|nr:DUF368 domain-containing protein [Oscillospiraceae bacterium]
MKTLKQNAIALIVGIIHGIAMVVPGVSGGTVLIIFGVYDKCCAAMALDFRTIKRDLLFYALLVIGTLAGIGGFSHAIMFLIERYPLHTYLLLAAMIIFGLPAIVRAAVVDKASAKTDVKVKFRQALKRFKPICLVPFTLGALGITAIYVAELLGAAQGGSEAASQTTSRVLLAVYSGLGAVAAITPGVSGSFMLVAFGIYEPLMNAVRELTRLRIDWGTLVPAGIGIVVGLVAGARVILALLKRHRLMVYSAILGMVAASVIMLVVSSLMLYG